MKGGTRAALAIGVGYMLGRRRKMRLATMLAVGAAAGGLGPGGAILRRGAEALGSTEALSKLSPQLGDVAQTIRDDLVDAGKAAAMAAVNSRIDSLTSSLHERAETLRNPEAAAEGVTQTLRRPRRGGGAEGEEEEPEDYAEEAEETEDQTEDYEEPEPEEPEPEEPEPEPRRPRRQPARAAGRTRSQASGSQASGRGRAPVSRPRR
ncbi:MAG: hypothetical protein JO132_20965 [Streptosporangiaceae bacterium]|nr:hypothetical protein [Streptosporangiaceae bacterium]